MENFPATVSKKESGSYWIKLDKSCRTFVDKATLPDFSEISKKDFEFLMVGECHFVRFDKDRTPMSKVFIRDSQPFEHRFYVAADKANLYKILFTKVQEDGSEMEYFANWVGCEMEISHFRKKVVYLAHDTIDGYQMKVQVDFSTENIARQFVAFFLEGIENDKNP